MSKKEKDVLDVKLTAEEQEIEEALTDLSLTANFNEEMAFARAAASNYLRKDAKINIRLSQYDIDGLRRIAAKEGLMYQSLISSVLHKYVSSYLGA